MKSIIDTSEILGTVALRNGQAEVCASAEASHASGKVAVRLDAFLRPIHVHGKEERLSADWLPHPETITESVSLEEASEVARDIFHKWVRKIRAATPSIHSSAT